ncbi:autotransporter outer membrane beta-barrel domain-containing protein [Aliiroseovarius sp. PrR006]|uniref:autotransporter outer membrane beta-barrel domain-containing protein n=1 Tax=Aliiroseovarius sp. PrR006 TaxID=2706883 RepID=UPI0013D12A0E|nr:autotransporter outer membrane beta-barrel domain-containing protein [Aliiroseovarius sp. PrR006]NDW54305.1 autotransporter outer membrane beta-barrel domain-containing protein [Aliiroseovarius sp. PrR006]
MATKQGMNTQGWKGVPGMFKGMRALVAVLAVGLFSATQAQAHSNYGNSNISASTATAQPGDSIDVSFDYTIWHAGHGPVTAVWEIYLDGVTLLASGTNIADGNSTDVFSINSTVLLPGNIAPGPHQIVITTYYQAGSGAVSSFIDLEIIDPAAEAQALIATLSEARGRLIIQNGPNLERRIGRLNSRSRNVAAAGEVASRNSTAPEGEAAAGGSFLASSNAVAPTSPYDLWIEAAHAKFSAGNMDGDFNIIHMGVDRLVNSDLLIGLGLQLDHARLSGAGAEISGSGFMVGPYLTKRVHDNLYLDARVAWGRSSNDVSPFGTYTDTVGAERWLATAALIGDFQVGDLTIQPEARLSWFEETTDAYLDSNNIAVTPVTTSFGSFELGPTISRSYTVGSGAILTANLSAKSIWTYDFNNGGVAASATEGHSGRVEIGLDYKNDDNLLINGSVFVDGGGNGWNALGATVGLDYTF